MKKNEGDVLAEVEKLESRVGQLEAENSAREKAERDKEKAAPATPVAEPEYFFYLCLQSTELKESALRDGGSHVVTYARGGNLSHGSLFKSLKPFPADLFDKRNNTGQPKFRQVSKKELEDARVLARAQLIELE